MSARDQMITAAERIAAEQGLGAMSLRAVQAAAGQQNNSAAKYHFGSRTGLIEAVIATRMGPINERRLEMLEALDTCGVATAPPQMRRRLVEALVLPLAQATLGIGPSHWARFLAQGFADPEVTAVVRHNFEGRSFRALRRRLLAAMPSVPEPLRAHRLDQAVAMVVNELARAEALDAATGRDAVSAAARVANLLDVCVAVLEAPVSPETLEVLPC